MQLVLFTAVTCSEADKSRKKDENYVYYCGEVASDVLFMAVCDVFVCNCFIRERLQVSP